MADAPQGRTVLRPGADPLALIEAAAAQTEAAESSLAALRATLVALAGCFGTPVQPPTTTPADKAPPRTLGRPRPAPAPPATATDLPPE